MNSREDLLVFHIVMRVCTQFLSQRQIQVCYLLSLQQFFDTFGLGSASAEGVNNTWLLTWRCLYRLSELLTLQSQGPKVFYYGNDEEDQTVTI